MSCCISPSGALFSFRQRYLTFAQTGQPPIPLPSPFTPIVDNANVIDADTENKLGSIYLNLKQRADIEFAVVTVDTIGGQDIFEYSLAIYRGWGIGSKTNDGFLLFIAVKDRKYYTQVGYHLEGDLNDGLVGEIQRQYLVPEFKRANYSKGVYDTVQAYVATLAEKRGFTIEGIDQNYAYRGIKGPTSGGRRIILLHAADNSWRHHFSARSVEGRRRSQRTWWRRWLVDCLSAEFTFEQWRSK